jgi:hypothetical protein
LRKAEALIEAATQDIIGFIMQDRNIELEQAMDLFYNSDLYEKLYDEETGLYLEGSAYIYELLKDMLNYSTSDTPADGEPT